NKEQGKEEEFKDTTENDMLVAIDEPLTEIGQYHIDITGKITLLKYKKVNESTKIGPVELTMTDLKLLKLEPTDEFYDQFLYQFTNEKDVIFAQIGFVVK